MVQKEKQVKSYTRKSKSGKQVQVKSYSAKYESAEDMVKEALKQKKGAGKELLETKKKKPVAQKEEEKSPYEEYGFTKDEFKEWYEGTGSKADKKVEKALKKAMGTKAYTAFSDKAADEYKKGGAHSFFTKGLEDMKSVTSKKETAAPKKAKTSKGISSKKDAIEWFKGNSNYIVTKDGKVYEKLSDGKTGTEVKSKYLVSHAQREDNLARVTDKVAALASEYGFKKSEADTVALWTGGKGEPNGKLYRKMSDIPQKVVSDYAKFEDVSPRQARLEMLGMPVGEYNSYLKDAGITPLKKEVKSLVEKNGGTVDRGNKTSRALRKVEKELSRFKKSPKNSFGTKKEAVEFAKSKGLTINEYGTIMDGHKVLGSPIKSNGRWLIPSSIFRRKDKVTSGVKSASSESKKNSSR